MKYKILIFLLLSLFLNSCNKLHYDTYYALCVDTNEHGFKPRENTYNKRVEYSYEYYFDSTCIYTLNQVDQQDWNKLGGFSFDLHTNHQNSFMIGWRYMDGYFQLAPYQHLNGQRVLHEPAIYEISPNDKFIVTMIIDYDLETVTLTIVSQYEMFHEQFFYHNINNRSREIFPWFGGNNAATHYMCIYRKQI